MRSDHKNGSRNHGSSPQVFLCIRGDPHRVGLESLLADAGIAVLGSTGDGVAAPALVGRLGAEVVVADLSVPGLDLDGLRSQAGVGTNRPPGMVVLTTDHDDVELAAALRWGARGVVHRDGPVTELARAIEAVAGGGAHVADALLSRVLEMAYAPPVTAPVCDLTALTSREWEVLELLAQGLSNLEISHRMVVSVSTVKHHVSHILKKLRLKTRLEAALLAACVVNENHRPSGVGSTV